MNQETRDYRVFGVVVRPGLARKIDFLSTRHPDLVQIALAGNAVNMIKLHYSCPGFNKG